MTRRIRVWLYLLLLAAFEHVFGSEKWKTHAEEKLTFALEVQVFRRLLCHEKISFSHLVSNHLDKVFHSPAGTTTEQIKAISGWAAFLLRR